AATGFDLDHGWHRFYLEGLHRVARRVRAESRAQGGESAASSGKQRAVRGSWRKRTPEAALGLHRSKPRATRNRARLRGEPGRDFALASNRPRRSRRLEAGNAGGDAG